MHQSTPVPFKISTIDPLGQGVSKVTDKITFIPKTLPGEEGEAIILDSKKGVQFAELKKLNSPSPLRINPECPHYEKCPGCHYLHTDYSHEIEFKKQGLQKILHKISYPEIKIFAAPRRMNYRNRIQLHYDLKKNLLGMHNGRTNSIAPIGECKIARASIQKALHDLYTNDHWKSLVPKGTTKGHLELYEQNDQLRISWNKPYADGGFTQVFEEMNQLLKNHLVNWCQTISSDHIIDLFAGKGNLSNELQYSKRLCFDIYSEANIGPEFFSLNLYEDSALEKFRKIKRNIIPEQVDLLILDPPRSGLKDIMTWLEEIRPAKVAYVSCDPHTLARDLMNLSTYRILEVSLYDFFPSTFHFETMVFLERK